MDKTWSAEPDWNRYARCPHCGFKRGDSDELLADSGIEDDGDEAEIECSGCHLVFTLVLSVEYFWRTSPLEAEGDN